MGQHIHQKAPFVVPTDDGKLIEEHFGFASERQGDMSIAHMIVPPQWSEPAQTPEFDEFTLMVRGRKMIEVDGNTVELTAGESLLVPRGSTVRYSNPYEEEAEYWSVCLPAFTPERARREE
jgi:mannose-6-phosphate isomerase-like protein (cupin superfamily)